MKLESIFPFLVWFRLITKNSLKADLVAGLTGAVIVLPQRSEERRVGKECRGRGWQEHNGDDE